MQAVGEGGLEEGCCNIEGQQREVGRSSGGSRGGDCQEGQRGQTTTNLVKGGSGSDLEFHWKSGRRCEQGPVLRQRSEDGGTVICAEDRQHLGGVRAEDGGDFGGNAEVVARIATGTVLVANSVPKGYSSE